MPDENKYIIYLRKSSENEDRQIQSLERQLDETNKLIEQHQVSIVETISESRSAKIPHNRPGFTRMIGLIQQGKANGVVCWHANRLARNPYEWGVIQQLLIDGKLLSIITKDREYKPEDNVLIMSVESGLSSQYSRDLGKVVKSGLEKKLSSGHPPIKARLGYLNTKSSVRGSNTIISDPDRWQIIRKGFDLMLSRSYTVAQILEILSTQYHLRTKPTAKGGNKPLSRSGLYDIFTDPFYYGYFRYNGKIYKGNYPAMITPDEFDTIQHILGRGGKPRQKRHVFSYTGLIKCGHCGASITASRKTKVTKTTHISRTYTFYHCTKRKAGVPCPVTCYIREEELEQMIIDELSHYDIRECFRDWALAIAKERHQLDVEQDRKLIEAQKSAEMKLHQEMDRLLEMRIDGEINAETYQQKKAEKEALLVRVQSRLAEAENKVGQWIPDIEGKLGFTCNVVEKLTNGAANIKKEICHRFGWNWVLKDKKLLIDKQEWLEPIKNYKEKAEAIFDVLEPETTFAAQGQEASFDALRPVVRALVNEVGTRRKDI